MSADPTWIAPWAITFSQYLTGSLRNGKMASSTFPSMVSICWWQPSPQADMAIKAACLYRQSSVTIKHSVSNILFTNAHLLVVKYLQEPSK